MDELMAVDFAYIDSWREGVVGRDKVMVAVRHLFAADPDFGLEVDRMSFQSPFVLMSGTISSGHFGKNRRAVWRVLCKEGRVSEWQSWADGGPPPMSRALAPQDACDLSDRATEKPEVSDI